MKNILSLAALAFAIALAPQAFAHEGHDHGHGGACAPDMKKFCGDVKMGDHDAMRTCMMSHESELSAACKKAHAKMQAMMNEMKTACQGDMDKFCKDKAEGKDMHECMMSHQKELSASCTKAHTHMQKMMPMHHSMKGEAKEANAKPAGDAPAADKSAEGNK